jgi:hypothetical protein
MKKPNADAAPAKAGANQSESHSPANPCRRVCTGHPQYSAVQHTPMEWDVGLVLEASLAMPTSYVAIGNWASHIARGGARDA